MAWYKALPFHMMLLLLPLLVFIDASSKAAILQLRKKVGILIHGPLATSSWGSFSLSITPTFNSGAAFGLLSKHTLILLVLRTIIISTLLYYLLITNKKFPFLLRFSLILVTAGAIGNVLDLLTYGKVIDFLSLSYDQHFFPTFNFADVFISLGSILLMFSLLFDTFPFKIKRVKKKKKKKI